MANKSKKKYKLKTYKGAAKRFKITATGKVLRAKGGKSHLRRRKSKRTKQQLSKNIEVKNTKEVKRIKRLAPYLKKYKQNPPA